MVSKKHLVVLIIAALFTFQFASGQYSHRGSVTSNISFTAYESGLSVVQTYDHGYFISGAGNLPTQLIRLDSSLNLVWDSLCGFIDTNTSARSSLQTRDSGFIITGYGTSIGNSHIFLLKLNKNGNNQWLKLYSNPGFEGANSVILSNDGGYAICGSTRSVFDTLNNNANIYILKLDSSGNVQWSRTVGDTNEFGSSIIQTKDNGYAVTGYTSSYGAGSLDVYIIKLDSLGNLKWTETIGDSNQNTGNSIVQTFDGGYAIAGATVTPPSNNQIYVIRIDSIGNLLWTKKINNYRYSEAAGNSIIQSFDSGLVIAGQLSGPFLIKLDRNGNMLGYTANDSNNSTSCSTYYNVIQTSDSGYAVTGALCNDIFDGNTKFILDKFDKSEYFTCAPNNNLNAPIFGIGGSITSRDSGRISTKNPTVANFLPHWLQGHSMHDCILTTTKDLEIEKSLKLFPNPASKIVNVPVDKEEFIYIYNVLGDLVLYKPIDEYRNLINVENLKQGVYFYQIVDHERTRCFRGKLIIVR